MTCHLKFTTRQKCNYDLNSLPCIIHVSLTYTATSSHVSFITGVICSSDIQFNIGVNFDNFHRYDDLSALDDLEQFGSIHVNGEPVIETQENSLYRTWWPNKPGRILFEVNCRNKHHAKIVILHKK